MLTTGQAEREEKKRCGDTMQAGRTRLRTVLILLRFQRDGHRFREFKCVAGRQVAITLRVNQLECTSMGSVFNLMIVSFIFRYGASPL